MLARRNVGKFGLLAALLAKISLRAKFYRDAVGIRKGSTTTFSFKDLETRLPEHLEGIPLPFVKKASRHYLRYMDGYRTGLNGPELDFAVTKYNGHRTIPREHLDVKKAEFKRR